MKTLLRLIVTTSLVPPMLLMPACSTGLSTRYDDATDVCRAARQPLIQTEAAFNQTVLTSAAAGTALGALAGFAFGQDARSAAIGAGSGLVAGAAAGYAKAKFDQARTREQLQASVDADADRDLQQLQGSTGALRSLIDCRNSQIAQVAAQFSSHTITRQQALAEYRHIDEQMLTDDKLIAEVLGKSSERTSAYVSARSRSTELPAERLEHPSASNATITLVNVQQVALAEQQRHRAVRSGLETRISDINAVVGERETDGSISFAWN